MGISDTQPFDVVEVSFKNGSRKEFFKNPPFTRTTTGDYVLVESTSGGYDLGTVSLSGELVRLQMKRKRVRSDARLGAVIRKAHERDLERLDELRRDEKKVMVQARTIARTLDLQMKVCDIEFQGDGRKCTFFYTADGRVDFRELIRLYAKEFKVKIEMRQIGARQESARIGGLGNCGRELCCSTWLTEFKSVNTAAARYQNLAINQTKLSGMCGRLKCCLNYELDTYIDALEDFPDKADRLKTKAGLAVLMKTDVFKRLMYFAYAENKSKFYTLHVDQVWEAMDMIKAGDIPGSLDDILAMAPPPEDQEEEEPDFENVENVIQLPLEIRKKKKKKKKNGRGDTAATAVERAEQADKQRAPFGGGGRSGGQARRPDNRPQNGSRPEQRTNRPDQPKGPQEPRSDRPEQRTNRPDQPKGPQEPRSDRPEQRTNRPDQPKGPQEPRSDRPEQRTNRPDQPKGPQEPRSDRSEQRTNRPDQPKGPQEPRSDRSEQSKGRPEQRGNRPGQKPNRPDANKGGDGGEKSNNNPPKPNPPKED
jgi:cell fate regulator YaaT (PSP1 superfamily)